MSDVFTLSEAADAIAERTLSPVELTRSCLDRIARIDGNLKAFLHLDEEGAMASASRAADEIARGRPRSPLHGVPVAVKDLIDVAGMPTTAASKVPGADGTVDAPIVATLRRAGAVFVGKSNCDEFALGVVSEPTRNPWDPARIPGGSSGGSAAAVAAGMAIAALGTDTAGSIRIPAALCGVAGLKPRSGVLPTEGVMALAPSLDSIGPIARRVADVALVWHCLAGGSEGAAPASLSIGIAPPEALGEVDENVATAYLEAVTALENLGPVTTVAVPAFSEFRRPNGIVLLTEALAVHRSRGWWPEREHLYSSNVAANLRYAATVDEAALVSEKDRLGELCARFLDAISRVDVVVVPTTPRVAPLASEVSADARERLAITTGLSRLTGPVNALPLAAVTVPWSLSDGLPVGIDVIARNETLALEAAARLGSFAPGTGTPELADA